jgi:eukaryotic-like serine/threonine-protein kinase
MDCLACHHDNHEGARFCAKCGAPLPAQKIDADPLIGQTVGGRYRVTGVLGEGGMGRVYVAEQQMGTTFRKVAVKTLLSQYAKDPKTVGRFMREVGTVSELEHPNTIKVYDFGKIEGTDELYIAMELLQGKSLEDVLATERPLPPERVDRIVGQICGSLQEAHEKGIVHRDLKPANIFLTRRAGEDDVVKVLDFGIAKAATDPTKGAEQKLTQQGTILGTPPYMSPEQFMGVELDGRSDLYSLGILAFEMLTGRMPFEADTGWQWMNAHSTERPLTFEAVPEAANVPEKMRRAVMHALAKKPADRPATARDFFDELTLGSARMSALGLGAGGVGSMAHVHSSPSSALVGSAPTPAAASPRTETGVPLAFPDAGPLQAGAPLAAPAGAAGPGFTQLGAVDVPQVGRTMTGDMPLPAHLGVPTAGGQAFPIPPAPQSRSSGSTFLGVAAAAVLGLSAAGGFLWWRARDAASPTDAAETIDVDRDREKEREKPTSRPTETATTTASSTTPSRSPLPQASEFDSQTDSPVMNAATWQCSARSVREWVRVRCAGRPESGKAVNVSVLRGSVDGGSTSTVEGALVLTFPFEEGTDLSAAFGFEKESARFDSSWPSGTPRPTSIGAFAEPSTPTQPSSTATSRPTQTSRPTATAPTSTATNSSTAPTSSSTGLRPPTRPTATATTTSTSTSTSTSTGRPTLKRPIGRPTSTSTSTGRPIKRPLRPRD